MTRRIHLTVGYLIQALREKPELAEGLINMPAAKAISKLETMNPDALVSCGHDDCQDCGAAEKAEAESDTLEDR